MSKLTTLTAACALAIGFSGAAQAQDADTVIATVNGTEITLGHVILYRASLGDQVKDVPADEILEGVVDQLISMTVLAENQELDQIGTYSVENETRSLKARGVLNDLMDVEVSDAEITAAYDAAFADFEGQPEFNASHILVETEEAATDLIGQLEGGADFAELARENSTGPSGPSGGSLGWFGPGQMVPAFDAAVQGMDVGEVAGPVETQFGWHVIQLNDSRTTEAPSVEEIRDRLAQQVVNDRVTAQIEERRAAAEIERPELDLDPEIVNNFDLITQ